MSGRPARTAERLSGLIGAGAKPSAAVSASNMALRGARELCAFLATTGGNLGTRILDLFISDFWQRSVFLEERQTFLCVPEVTNSLMIRFHTNNKPDVSVLRLAGFSLIT